MSINWRFLQSVVYITALAMFAGSCEAGSKVRVARQNRKAAEAQTGIGTLKWQTRVNRTATASNITAPLGWFSPGRLIWGIITGW